MIKKILLLNLLLFSTIGISQEITKKTEIYKHVSGEYINAIRTIENGEEKDLKIHFLGRNHKYQHIDDLLSFSYSSPSEFYEFLNKLIECFKYDKDTSLKVNGLNVTVDKMMGKKIITLWDKDMLGYRLFNEKKLIKILKKYEKWCTENNVTYQ